MLMKNENLLIDIEETSELKTAIENKILKINDFYENTLIPKMISQPERFLYRIR